MKIKGTYTALVTPFKKDKSIDYKSLEKLLNLQIDAGVQGIVLFGTTGESPTIDTFEKHKILKVVEDIVKDKLDIIIGISSNDTKKTVNEIKGFSGSKAKAFLVGTPAYNKPTQKGLIDHFTKIANESYKPIILYNVPSRTGTNLNFDTVKILSEHPNIVGIKDASCNFDQVTKLMTLRSDKFSVLSGNDNQTISMMALGASGVISVASNIVPHELDLMVKYADRGNFSSARIVHEILLPLFEACFVETNPIPVKFMLSRLGLTKNYLREPLCPLSNKSKQQIKKIMLNYFGIRG